MPCMCRWIPKGSINSTILTNILRTLDDLGCYDKGRRVGFKPMLLLNAHGSRMKLGFPSCLNYVGAKWVVSIGVPYGTTLWEVDDSSQYNGLYKMACTRFKRKLLIMKRRRKMTTSICPWEIMLIVNAAWESSFVWVRQNIKAISERG